MTAAPLLQAEDLTVTLRLGGQDIPLLRDLNFSIRPGEILGVVGESGAGKSMLSRVLARQLPDNMHISAGELRFRGRNLQQLSAREHRQRMGRDISFIPQEPMIALNPVMTIAAQLKEHLRQLGHPRRQLQALCIAALEEVGLRQADTLLSRYPHQLSGGQCQRIMIALAFAGDPALVVCDEATTALDAVNQQRIISLIRRCQQKHGTAVLFITHDLSLAAGLCDTILVMYAGDMMEAGPAAQVLRQPQHPYTRALLSSRPALSGRWQPLIPLAGQMPAAAELAAANGCRFAGRCHYAQQECGQPVSLRQAGTDHLSRCRRDPASLPAPVPEEGIANEHYALGLLGTERPFLRVSGLCKTYTTGLPGRRRRQQALDDISFTLAPGEFVAVVGESGSGKSTLARTLMGLEKAESGQISLHERPLGHGESDWERRIRSIQMVFQDPNSALNPTRNVQSLMTQPMASRHFLPSERQQRAAALTEAVGLNPQLLLRLPQQLSGGQRQRVNIGRALCDIPQLLIADEIVSGLDVSVQAQILNLLLRLRREYKISLLLIAHDLAVVRYLCSRVLVMHQGRIVESGRPEDVFSNPQHPYTQGLVQAALQSSAGEVSL